MASISVFRRDTPPWIGAAGVPPVTGSIRAWWSLVWIIRSLYASGPAAWANSMPVQSHASVPPPTAMRRMNVRREMCVIASSLHECFSWQACGAHDLGEATAWHDLIVVGVRERRAHHTTGWHSGG